MRKLQYILTLLFVIGMMVLIFRFSAANGEESSGLSGRVCTMVVEKVDTIFACHWDAEKKEQICQMMQFPIRKGAHFSEYALLAFLLEWHLLSILRLYREEVWKRKERKRWVPAIYDKITWIALLVASCYAISDEIHQYFVPERACRVFDVCVDTIGASVGILVFILFYRIWCLIFERRNT